MFRPTNRPVTGLRTWRLALAFFGCASAYAAFDSLYFVGYRTRHNVSLLQAAGLPTLIAAAFITIAYGPWFRYIYRKRKLGIQCTKA